MGTGGRGDAERTPDALGAVTDAASFAAALTELRDRAGMSIRAVSRETGIPSATLGGYFSGRHLPQASQKAQFLSVLTTLGVPATELDVWWAALGRLRRVPAQRAGRGASPYRGLESYDVDDAEWFVGREELVDTLSAVVGGLLERRDAARRDAARGDAARGDAARRDAARGGAPEEQWAATLGAVSVVGASGSGKSSLVRAGLAARLRSQGVRVAVIAPGGNPAAALATGRAELGEPGPSRLLVVDQLEELFGDRVAPDRRRRFLSELVAVAQETGTVVVVTLRADFYGAAAAEAAMLPLLRSHQLLLGPPEEDSLRRVVLEPAARAGLIVEPELVELALRDVQRSRGALPDPSALPLLSHALLATWARAQRGRLTVSDYVAAGGVAGAVQRTAEQVYGSLDDPGRTTARRLFSQLVSVDDEGLVTRRRVHHADLAEDEELAPVVEAFVAGRILTATESTLEISHEVLLDAWPRLAEWVERDREVLRLRRRVSHAAADWDEHGRERDGLLRGVLLAQVQDAGPTVAGSLSGVERAFVTASVRDEEGRRRAAQWRSRLMRGLFGVVAVLAVVATLLSAYLIRTIDDVDRHRAEAEAERNRAVSRQVAIRAVQLRDREPAAAAQLAVAAHRFAPTVEARSALLEVTNLAPVARLPGPDGTMQAVASPDGALLATATADGVVRLWASTAKDPAGTPPAEPVATVSAHGGGELFAAAFSDDGRYLAVGGVDGVVTVMDVTDAEHPAVWPPVAAGATVHDLVLARGELLVATSDAALLRWVLDDRSSDAPAVRPLPSVSGFDGAVHAVAQAPDGSVATGSADGTVRLWSRSNDRLELARALPVGSTSTVVRSVAFDPEGELVAAGLDDATVRVWSTGTGRPVIEPLTGASSWVNAVAFDVDGRRLAGVASGGLAQIWDTTTWKRAWSAPGPANYTSVQFLAGGARLLTGAIDGTARLVSLEGGRLPQLGDNIWGLARPGQGDRMYVGVGRQDPMVAVVDVSDPVRPRLDGPPLRGPIGGGVLNGVVGVSPDGRLLVAGTSTGELVVWQVSDEGTHTLLGTVPAARELIENIAFSADGSRFVVSSDDGTATVFDIAPRGLPRQAARTEATPYALGVALSPDGTLVAVGGSDRQVRLFRVPTEGSVAAEPLAVLAEHESYVYAAGFSPDGDVLATGGADATVRLWDVSDPTRPTALGEPLRGPTDTVFATSFNGSGARLAAASQDGRVWLWRLDDPAHPRLEARLGSLGAGLFQVLFHPDGSLTAGGAAGVVGSWLTDEAAARELACSTSGAPVTEEEWKEYAPGVPYDEPCRA